MSYDNILQDETSLKQDLFRSNRLFDSKIWTITETAQFLDLAVGTIYHLVSKRKIPFRKKNKRLYFIPQEILNWIQEGD